MNNQQNLSVHSLKAKLNAQGYRLTPQRQLIFEIFQTLPTGSHVRANASKYST
jgi:Fur family ferric uptake transcriptional regulator